MSALTLALRVPGLIGPLRNALKLLERLLKAIASLPGQVASKYLGQIGIGQEGVFDTQVVQVGDRWFPAVDQFMNERERPQERLIVSWDNTGCQTRTQPPCEIGSNQESTILRRVAMLDRRL